MKNKEERTLAKTSRLQARNAALEEELQRQQDDRQRVLSVLEEAIDAAGKPKKRRGRFIWLLLVGAAAYTFGAKAGRERYEQITSWVKGLGAKTENADVPELGGGDTLKGPSTA